MGGSSLAPEVICATAGVELTVLDSSDPDYVAAALADRLDRSVVVVSSKSGSTVETDSQRRAYEGAFTAAGIDPVGADRRRHRPGLAAGRPGPRGRLHRHQRRPRRRRPLLRPHRVRAGPERAGRSRHRRAARRGRRDRGRPAGRRRRQPRAPARRPDRGRGGGRGRQADPGRRRLGHLRFRRLGRAADRRVDRQDRQGRPAGRGRGRRRAQLRTRAPPTRSSSPSARAKALLPPADSAPASLGRSAPRCCSGSTPSRSAAGSSGSTRSTSRTSRAPSRPRATCSTAPPVPTRPTSPTAPSRCGPRPVCSATPPRSPAPSTLCWVRSTATTATSR